MARHHGGERVEFEIEIRVTGGDHFVVNEFVFGAEMAFKAFSRPVNDVSRLVHAKLDGLFVRPAVGRVRAKPARGWTVAVFARDSFGDFKLAALLFRFCIERVADEAFRRFFCFSTQFQNPCYAFADVPGESLIRAAVLVFQNPGGIFSLENATASDRFYASVATCGGAGAGTDVFHWLSGRIFCLGAKRGGKQRKKSANERSQNVTFVQSEHPSAGRVLLYISLVLGEVNDGSWSCSYLETQLRSVVYTRQKSHYYLQDSSHHFALRERSSRVAP